MESDTAIKRLAALAHEGRLAIFRHLVKAGPEGIAAGEIVTLLGLPQNSVSTQLGILVNAGLIASRRAGRSIIYSAQYDGMSDLLLYLTEDCCQGRPEICAPLGEIASRTACCGT